MKKKIREHDYGKLTVLFLRYTIERKERMNEILSETRPDFKESDQIWSNRTKSGNTE